MLNSLSNLDILLAFLLLLCTSIIGIFLFRRTSEEEYLIAGRSVSAIVVGGTIAVCIIGGGVILVFSEYAYKYGLSAFAIFGGLGLGLIALLFVSKAYKPDADEQHFYTIPDFFTFHWGKAAGLLASIVVMGWAFGFVIMQLISSAILLEKLLPIPYWGCVIISIVVVLIYLIASGFRAVVITDLIQYIALALFLILIAFFAIPKIDYVAVSKHFGKLDILDASAFFILGCLNITVSADLWQRIYAAKSPRAARNGILWGLLLLLIVGVLLFVPILYARSLPIKFDPNNALLLGLTVLPHGIIGLAYSAILIAVVSTLDTMIFILGISSANDIEIRYLSRPVDGRIRSTKFWMIAFGIGGSIIAIVYSDLLQTGLALSSLGLCLVPAVLGRIRWKIRSSTVIGSLFGGLLIFIILLLMHMFTPVNSVLTLPASMFGALIGSIFGRIRRS